MLQMFCNCQGKSPQSPIKKSLLICDIFSPHRHLLSLQIQRERRRGTGKGAGVVQKVVVRNITAETNAKAVIAGAALEIIKNTGACIRLLNSPRSYLVFCTKEEMNGCKFNLTGHFSSSNVNI